MYEKPIFSSSLVIYLCLFSLCSSSVLPVVLKLSFTSLFIVLISCHKALSLILAVLNPPSKSDVMIPSILFILDLPFAFYLCCMANLRWQVSPYGIDANTYKSNKLVKSEACAAGRINADCFLSAFYAAS